MHNLVEGSALLVIDYNLSRIDDVKALFQYAKNRYGYTTVLIRDNPSSLDYDMADCVINADPLSSQFVHEAILGLNKLPYFIACGLVFSDNAVQSGATLLNTLGVYVDSPTLAVNAFCKEAYRQEESNIRALLEGQGMWVPSYKRIANKRELEEFVAASPGGVVVKPTKEGNNRGVVMIESPTLDSINAAMEEVGPYLENGVIVEQRIPFTSEYSFDGIGAQQFITQKFTARGTFPVEYGQLVPAEINAQRANKIKTAGNIANIICGQRNGPFHNEVRVADDNGTMAVVEPNRRPAGMKIWELAARVYGQNFYHRWIDSLHDDDLGVETLSAQGAAMLFQLPSSEQIRHRVTENEVEQIFRLFFCDLEAFFIERDLEIVLDEVQLKVSPNEHLRYPPRDNADFYGWARFYFPRAHHGISQYFWTMQLMWGQVVNQYLNADITEVV